MGNNPGNGDYDKVEAIFFQLNKIVGNISLNGEGSPQPGGPYNELAAAINDYCFLQGGFYVEEIGDRMAIKDTMVELTNPVYAKLSEMMKAHFISKISFSAGVDGAEVKSLVQIFGIKPAVATKEGVEEEIKKADFNHIKINEQSIELVMDGGFSVEDAEDATGKVGKGRKILVVEDNAKLSAMYKEELIERGYDVRLASNGMEAMDKIAGTDPPELMILDIKMAGMSGVEVLERMKQKKFLIPVIIATAYPAMKEDVTIKTFPNLEFIQKPFSYDNLSRMIGEMLIK